LTLPKISNIHELHEISVATRAAKSVEIRKELPAKSYMPARNYHSAIQVKSSNTPRIASKSPNGLHNFPR